MKKLTWIKPIMFVLPFFSACSVGPVYQRPNIIIPAQYKEAPDGWKFAQPCDSLDKGEWWSVFNDPQLNLLEKKLIISNQNIAFAIAQFEEAKALVKQAKSAYYPLITSGASATRQQNASSGSSITSGEVSPSNITGNSASKPFSTYNISVDATWVPDLWGSVRNSVVSSKALAHASQIQIAAVSLLAQATLAQYYFQLRNLDATQKIYDDTVKKYQQLVNIASNKYHAGTVSRKDVLQSKSLLELAQVQALDNGIERARFEHAIAVLIGQPPSTFYLAACENELNLPKIPITVPSVLLERRPDIAAQERQVASANAQIGVEMAAYFPVLTLTGSEGFNSTHLASLLSKPANYWSLGAQLFEILFDGGARDAKVCAAKARYLQQVATYRQTILNAFQNVEDNLVASRILAEEISKQSQAVQTATQALTVTLNSYQAGAVDLTEVLNTELTLFTALKGKSDIHYRTMIAAVGLIQALGGGWQE